MASPALTIGGERVTPEVTFEVEDPATGEVFATAPEASEADLDRAFEAARGAQRAWARRTDRAELLHACADALRAHHDELALLLTTEQGKPLPEAAREVSNASLWLDHYADATLPPRVLESGSGRTVTALRRPLGVIAAIVPWNVPLALAMWKVAPALAAGNTIVVKPSPYTPLTTLRAGELLNEVLPAGVVNVIAGGDHLGPAMTAHPVPRKVSFTGSIATGSQVAQSAGRGLKRVTLELGGNDAAILLDDVDVESVADGLFASAFANSGQICVAVKRVYAPRAHHDALVEALAARASAAVLGPGVEPGVELGPLAVEMQRDRVESLVTEAVASGARIAAGGSRWGERGYFYRPTILYDVPTASRIELEEQFGPALPVLEYDDLDTVLDRVNDGPHGLGGSVWSTDVDRAEEVARQLDVGTSWVNQHRVLAPHLPFGGHKSSGVGVENGEEGLHEFTAIQVVHRPEPVNADR